MSQEPYQPEGITREQVDTSSGLILLDFGANWCPHCQRIDHDRKAWLSSHPTVKHIGVADGKGLPLGRSFTVKLWPSLILIRDGKEIARVVRPTSEADFAPLSEALSN